MKAMNLIKKSDYYNDVYWLLDNIDKESKKLQSDARSTKYFQKSKSLKKSLLNYLKFKN